MNQETYQFPDRTLRSAVLAKLSTDHRTTHADLRVGVLNGIVHLAGKTPLPETRVTAAELAGSVPGVRGVVNRIEAPGAPRPARAVNLDLKE